MPRITNATLIIPDVELWRVVNESDIGIDKWLEALIIDARQTYDNQDIGDLLADTLTEFKRLELLEPD